jgi:regulator of sigma E protease
MPDILIAILAVIFVLGVAINIHELGHFLVAKFFGMRVEAYSFFGLGPRIWGFKIGHTDYRISAIPLGAYVKLYGDEATQSLEGGRSDGEEVPASELYELRPRWQKFLVMLGGPFMNILLALTIPFFVALSYGIPAIPEPVISFVKPGGAADQAGIRAGDKIINFDGTPNPTWRKIKQAAAISPGRPLDIVIERAGSQINLKITPSEVIEKGQKIGEVDMLPDTGLETVVVMDVNVDSPAAKAGFANGDQIVQVGTTPVRNLSHFMTLIQENKDSETPVTVLRAGERKTLLVKPNIDESGRALIGVQINAKSSKVRESATIGEAAGFAFQSNYDVIALTGRVFGQMFSGQRSVRDAGLAGPIGIVGLIVSVVREEGFAGLLSLLTVISLNLGIFNLLPIPLLDGGQILVLGIEKVLSWFGKTLTLAMKERIQLAGLALILLLMVFTLYLDLSKFF